MRERKTFDLSRLTSAQLMALEDAVERELAHRRERLKSRGGLLVDGEAPRFRNPDNSAETWSGRGSQPAWVRRALAAGRSLAELEVIDNRPIPAAFEKPERSND